MASNAFERPTDGPSLDRIFGVLADERRRNVLDYLRKGADDTANVETLADQLAESDAVAYGSETTDEREQDIAVELSHVHLPKLDAIDVVEYAPDSQTVKYEGDETAEALLDVTTEDDSTT
jgi:hypothetical protein